MKYTKDNIIGLQFTYKYSLDKSRIYTIVPSNVYSDTHIRVVWEREGRRGGAGYVIESVLKNLNSKNPDWKVINPKKELYEIY